MFQSTLRSSGLAGPLPCTAPNVPWLLPPQLWARHSFSVTGQTPKQATSQRQQSPGEGQPGVQAHWLIDTAHLPGSSLCGTRTPQPEPICVPPTSWPRTSRRMGNPVNREPGWVRAALSRAGRRRINSAESSRGERLRLLMHGAAALPLSQRTHRKQSATYFVCLQPGLWRGPVCKPAAGIQSSRPGHCLGRDRRCRTAKWVERAGGSGTRSRGRVYPEQKEELSLHRGTRRTSLPSHMCSGFCRQWLLGPQFGSAGPRGATQPRGPWAWPDPRSIVPPRSAQPVTQTSHSSCPHTDTEPSLLHQEHRWRGAKGET